MDTRGHHRGESLFNVVAHQVFPGDDAQHMVVVIHYGQVAQTQAAEDNVGSVQGELLGHTQGGLIDVRFLGRKQT